MIDKQQALEIIDKRDFFNDRAGRELWNDKPKEIQDEDIRNAHEDYVALREYVLNQPKVGEWIPVEERLPKIGERALITTTNHGVRFATRLKYGWDGYIFPYAMEEVTAWQPLPEPYEVKDND